MNNIEIYTEIIDKQLCKLSKYIRDKYKVWIIEISIITHWMQN